jgi:hypothetical protein
MTEFAGDMSTKTTKLTKATKEKMDDRIASEALAIEIDRHRTGTRVAGQVASIGQWRSRP